MDVANCIRYDCKFLIRNFLLCRLRIKDKLDKFLKAKKNHTVYVLRSSFLLLFLPKTEYKVCTIVVYTVGYVKVFFISLKL
jgi:hypothetical protein